MAREEEPEEKPKKKASPIIVAGVVAVMSVVAVGAGYGIAAVVKQAQMPGKASTVAEAQTTGDDDDEATNDVGSAHRDANSVAVLDPIIVTLPDNDNTWLRLEMAIVLDASSNTPDEYEKAQMANDVSGFLRTMQLDKVFYPSGYLHLKEDLLDRVRLSAGEGVRDVMILSLVAE